MLHCNAAYNVSRSIKMRQLPDHPPESHPTNDEEYVWSMITPRSTSNFPKNTPLNQTLRTTENARRVRPRTPPPKRHMPWCQWSAPCPWPQDSLCRWPPPRLLHYRSCRPAHESTSSPDRAADLPSEAEAELLASGV